MDNFAELLEHELADAFEVKDKNSLHRYTRLLAENIVPRDRYEQYQLRIENEIKMLTETMKQGFEAVDKRFEAVDKRFEDMYKYMDKRFEAVDKRFEDMYKYMNIRFEAVDKRFEDMNKRFNMMFAFMTFGFSVIAVLMTLYKFIIE